MDHTSFCVSSEPPLSETDACHEFETFWDILTCVSPAPVGIQAQYIFMAPN